MELLRTPDACFENLPDFPWEPTYRRITALSGDVLRIASVETGPEDGPVVLLMHGEPSWSYLYRFMIARLASAGCRVVAPDLVGFGRSDKPAAQHDYSYARHVQWMTLWLNEADLQDITLFCQDWGGLIGLRLVAAQPDRFARVATANTFLPTGYETASPAFLAWRDFARDALDFDAGAIVQRATLRNLSDTEVAAYNAPFPDMTFKSGARRFPQLVPISSDDPEAPANRAAWETLQQWTKPWLTLFSDEDPITRGGDTAFQRLVPGCAGQPHAVVHGGHFLQEDASPALAEHLLAWMPPIPPATTPTDTEAS